MHGATHPLDPRETTPRIGHFRDRGDRGDAATMLRELFRKVSGGRPSIEFRTPQFDPVPGVSNRWDLDDGRTLALLTPDELHALPAGTHLVSIHGREVVTGTDRINEDIRYGFVAFGRVV